MRLNSLYLPYCNWLGLRIIVTIFYRFVLSDATKVGSSTLACNRVINSSEGKTGSIFSPNYPGHYPSGVECRYLLRGEPRERVRLNVTYLDLFYTADDPHSRFECTGQDSILIETGMSGTSKLSGETKFARVGAYCGSRLPPAVMSSENILRVTLKTLEHSISTGFHAVYSFITDYGIKIGEQDLRRGCTFRIQSNRIRNGTITSPNYPGLYPKNTECRYELIGAVDERVTLNFRFMDIDGIPPDCRQGGSDYLEVVSATLNSSRDFSPVEPPRRLCGMWNMKDSLQGTGRDLKHIKSTSNIFLLTFKSNDALDAMGFEAYFEFSEVQIIQQESTTESLRTSGCRPTVYSVTGLFKPLITSLLIVLYAHLYIYE